MTILVPIALFGWIPVSLLMFAFLPPRKAVIYSIMFGWLFLPVAGYPIPGLPDFTRSTATSLGALLGVALFDPRRFTVYRFRWFDLPAIGWVLVPLPSALSNGMGFYPGFAALYSLFVMWGIPWFLGRIYFTDLSTLKELALAFVLGGLVYTPFCWYEMRMSPHLHTFTYGFHQHSFSQTRRGSGWRPTVFLQHGLAVSLWMATSALAAAGLARWSRTRRILGAPKWIPIILLSATTILCRSGGASALLLLGLLCLLRQSIRWHSLAVLALTAYVAFHIIARSAGILHASSLTDLTSLVFSNERVGSLSVRLQQEETLLKRAGQQLILGWGPSGAYRVDEFGNDLVDATDGAWIIVFGKFGMVGLIAFLGMHLLNSVALSLGAIGSHHLPNLAAGQVIIPTLLVVYVLDSLSNFMPNPMLTLAAGASAAAAISLRSR